MQHKYPAYSAQVATRIIDGAAVVILADAGEVNVINPVGTRVWELIDGKPKRGRYRRPDRL